MLSKIQTRRGASVYRRALALCAIATMAFPATQTPAHARSALPVCIILYADDRPSTLEIREHEIAHCNGWNHRHRDDFQQAGYKAEQAPAKYKHDYRGELLEFPMSTREVKKSCGGHLGCQWFEKSVKGIR